MGDWLVSHSAIAADSSGPAAAPPATTVGQIAALPDALRDLALAPSQVHRRPPCLASSDIGVGWAAVHTNPLCEDAVEARLRGDGLRTFLPRYRRLLRGVKIVGGRRVRTKGPGSIVMRPLFSRYLFCELWPEQGWHDIARAPGVNRLVMQTRDVDSPPALIAGEVIQLIRESVDAGDFDDVRERIDRADLRKLLAEGRQPKVAMNGHPLIGKLIGLDDAGRASVLVELFNRPMITTTDARPLQVITAE